jgi:hypothetical protein
MRRNWLRSERSRSLYLSIRRVMYCSNYTGISLLSTTNKMLSNILLSRLTPCAQEIITDHQCGFRRSRSNTRGKMGIKWGCASAIYKPHETYDSVGRKVLYIIPTEYGIPMELVTLIKMCMNEIYSSRVRLGKHLSDMFRLRNGLKQGNAFLPLFFNFAFRVYH